MVQRVGDEEPVELHINHLHVGDIVSLQYGKVIPVDGLLIAGNQVTTNEAAMTGESDERRKEPIEVCMQRRAERGEVDINKVRPEDSHALPSCLMLSGTDVASGDGRMLVIMLMKK
jgi:magnesium-transporting ATPase (P-type)